jgi:hypothetical protein
MNDDVGWLFLYILGGLPGGAMVLYACTQPGLFDWRWFVVGLVLVTYFWWPAWLDLYRYGWRKNWASTQTWDERCAERNAEALRIREKMLALPRSEWTRKQRRNYPYI